ncbi:MAG: metallophosphoesterase family protein [Dehalococcoidales bacterium]
MKIIHFADLHLGVETYGRIDPATGLSSRFNDFLSVFDELVDYVLKNKVDLVLFCGDAYKSREPTQTQQREFARRINRLATAGIPTILLTGNHDLPNAIGRATATEIFDTLAIKNVYVANKPETYKIPTAGGDIQIVAIPWLRRSALLASEDTKNLNMEQLNQKMQGAIAKTISDRAAALDPSLPAILVAHLSVSSAKAGSESMMSIGQEPILLLSNVALPTFDYIALGHIHKQQVLSENPPVVYAGSLERIDFGEENDEKGFYVIDIEIKGKKKQVSFKFQPVNARRFLTISLDLKAEETDPSAAIIHAIDEQQDKLKNAIVRLNISLPSSLEGQLRNNDIREALKDTQNYTIARDIQRETRLRLGSRSAEEITPLDALKAYLETQQISPERQKTLLDYGEKLIKETES